MDQISLVLPQRPAQDPLCQSAHARLESVPLFLIAAVDVHESVQRCILVGCGILLQDLFDLAHGAADVLVQRVVLFLMLFTAVPHALAAAASGKPLLMLISGENVKM